jgi:hypothetical protein
MILAHPKPACENRRMQSEVRGVLSEDFNEFKLFVHIVTDFMCHNLIIKTQKIYK